MVWSEAGKVKPNTTVTLRPAHESRQTLFDKDNFMSNFEFFNKTIQRSALSNYQQAIVGGTRVSYQSGHGETGLPGPDRASFPGVGKNVDNGFIVRSGQDGQARGLIEESGYPMGAPHIGLAYNSARKTVLRSAAERFLRNASGRFTIGVTQQLPHEPAGAAPSQTLMAIWPPSHGIDSSRNPRGNAISPDGHGPHDVQIRLACSGIAVPGYARCFLCRLASSRPLTRRGRAILRAVRQAPGSADSGDDQGPRSWTAPQRAAKLYRPYAGYQFRQSIPFGTSSNLQRAADRRQSAGGPGIVLAWPIPGSARRPASAEGPLPRRATGHPTDTSHGRICPSDDDRDPGPDVQLHLRISPLPTRTGNFPEQSAGKLCFDGWHFRITSVSVEGAGRRHYTSAASILRRETGRSPGARRSPPRVVLTCPRNFSTSDRNMMRS